MSTRSSSTSPPTNCSRCEESQYQYHSRRETRGRSSNISFVHLSQPRSPYLVQGEPRSDTEATQVPLSRMDVILGTETPEVCSLMFSTCVITGHHALMM